MANTKIVVYGFNNSTGEYFPLQVDTSGFLNVHLTAIDQTLVPYGNDIDNIGVVSFGLWGADSFGYLWDGVGGWDRAHNSSATNLGQAVQPHAMLTTSPGEWTLTSAPAVTVAATATKAAAANRRHVLKSIQASINAVAAIAAPLTVVVRDGLSGVGAILWQDRLTAVIGTTEKISLTGLNIVGTAGSAMTVEFTAGPGAANFETISATGYSA